jgi:hypothetical protein
MNKKRQNKKWNNIPHFDPLINRLSDETKKQLLALKDKLIRDNMVATGAIKTQ